MKMHHINSFALLSWEPALVVGDRDGNIAVVDARSFEVVSKRKVGACTVQVVAASEARRLVATLNKNHSISVFAYHDGVLEHRCTSSTFEHMVENGRQVLYTSSQAFALASDGTQIVAIGPNCQALVFDVDPQFEIVLKQAITFEHISAPVTFRWLDNQRFLVGFGDGHIAKCDVESAAVEMLKFVGVDESVHWFEPITRDQFLVATDARCVVRLDVARMTYEVGAPFARDDFEHIVYDPTENAAYATSFDRNVYRIRPDDISCQGIVYRAHFKLRWASLLREDTGAKLIVQVRDGSLLKIDAQSGELEQKLQSSRQALWSAAWLDKALLVAGEGGVYEVTDGGLAHRPENNIVAKLVGNHYVKRLVTRGLSYAAGTTSGHILLFHNGLQVLNVSAPVRDITFCAEKLILACLESGELILADFTSSIPRAVTIFKTAAQPLWSLAYNENRGLIAVAERIGKLFLLKLEGANTVLLEESDCRLPKRMKWMDDDTLLITRSDCVDRVRYRSGAWIHEENFYAGKLNTVEDFVSMEENQFLVGVTYTKKILVWHYSTGRLLSSNYWSNDYAKGLVMAKGSESSFFVYGRGAVMKRYSLHDAHVYCTTVISPLADAPSAST